ncbi:Cell division control protein 7, partial [Coemansia sp. BCRC 34490]
MYALNSNTNTDTRCNKSASAGGSQESGETIKRPILLLTPEGIPIVQPAPKRPRPSVYGGSIDSIYAGSALNGAVEYLPAADDGSAGSVSVAHPNSGDHIVLQQYASREDRIDDTVISTHAEDNGGEDDAARTFVENGYGFHGREILQPRSVLAHAAQHCRPQISTETSLLAENIKDAFVVTDDNDDSRSVETAGTAETACGSNASPRRSNSSDKHAYHHQYQQQHVQEQEQAGLNYAEYGGSALAEAHMHSNTRVLGFGFGISNGDKACSGGGDEVEKMSKRVADCGGEKGSGGGISGGSAANQDKNGSDNEQEADDGMAGSNANNSGSDEEEEDEEEEGNEGEDGDDNDEDEDDEYLEEMRDCDVEGTVEEMGELEQLIPGLAEQYRLLGKIGEGTFSTVYKAIDLQHEKYENSSWTMIFRDDARSLDSSDTLLASGEETSDNDIDIDTGIDRAEEGPRGMRGGRRQRGESAGFRRRARVVAIKKIYVTSSPKRIANEISILDDLKGSKFIAPLVTAMRREDQVVVVLPYFRNDDFRRFYLDLPVDEMRWYFASLMSGLQY